MDHSACTKIAILGTAPASRMLAPFGDDTWQVWACSAGNMNILPRVDIWFEMHPIIAMMGAENRAMAEPFYAWLKQKSDEGAFQVVMCEAGTEAGGKENRFVPKAIPYPRDEMIALFGRNWFTSSVAYMMALAIARGATEIGLFGVDMAADMEHYSAQRAGCTRFIEIAEERGIKVHVPYESCLKVATPMYGYSEGTAFGRRLAVTQQIVDSNIAQINQQIAQLQNSLQYFSGAREQIMYFSRTWVDGADQDYDLGNLAEANAAIVAKAAEVAAMPPVADTVYMPLSAMAKADEPVPVDAKRPQMLPIIYPEPAADVAALDGAIMAELEAALNPGPVPQGTKSNGHLPAAPESDA